MQGIGITKRNKKRFAAQAMVMLLGAVLAHNFIVWCKRWLTEAAEVPKLKRYGVPRLVRDLFTMSGMIEVGDEQTIKRITLNRAAPLAQHCLKALLKREHVHVILGET